MQIAKCECGHEFPTQVHPREDACPRSAAYADPQDCPVCGKALTVGEIERLEELEWYIAKGG